MATRNAVCKKTVDDATGKIRFAFSDGRELVADASAIPEAVSGRLMLHGLSQKVGDSYAGAESVDEAYESARETIEQLVAGTWTTRTAGEPRIGLVVEALARVAGQTVEKAKAVYEKLDDDGKKAIRAHKGVKAAMDAIRAERSAKAAEGEAVDIGNLF